MNTMVDYGEENSLNPAQGKFTNALEVESPRPSPRGCTDGSQIMRQDVAQCLEADEVTNLITQKNKPGAPLAFDSISLKSGDPLVCPPAVTSHPGKQNGTPGCFSSGIFPRFNTCFPPAA